MIFLIQTVDGEIVHDFTFTLIESVKFNKWFHKDRCEMSYVLSDTILDGDFIPVGSVEFVTDFIKKRYYIVPKPVNIPPELMDHKFTGRSVINGTESDIHGMKFVKSNDKIKSFTSVCDSAPVGNYQISDVMDEIESEWRCFVHKGELVGLHNYAGEFTTFPDVNTIKEMISGYKSCPVAYTLDVGIYDGKTVVIEVHDFFSCGLYGFFDHRKYPYMLSQWFNSYIQSLAKYYPMYSDFLPRDAIRLFF